MTWKSCCARPITQSTERIEHGTEPRAWRELDVETVLKQILLAIDRVKNPADAGRHVALRGFSWIVEPMGRAKS